ncbi:Uncharacterized protein ALO40_01574 [Pseudomonas syringae pv. viburni]|uniref:Uncharacterized protein n=1 Tax=Pseudomonas syringae pv. viburni TaxID=251703 RepID=A0A0Q0GG63_9PSED|nr:Uncharacterized protein ALO40_01574 [Pseudomonas syringae pv. viburni]
MSIWNRAGGLSFKLRLPCPRSAHLGFAAGSRQFASKLAPTQATLCERFTGLEVREDLGFCPEGVGASGGYDGCDGLRSGPETDHFGWVW